MNRARISLEPLQPDSARKQAKAIRGILKSQRVLQMLGDERPNMLQRFQGRRESIGAVHDFIRTPGLLALIIHHNSVAKGVGLVAEDQTITHPTKGTTQGTWLGYWVAPGLSDVVHQEIASQLMGESEARCQFATGLPGHKSGFRWLMAAVGEPALLMSDERGYDLGVVNSYEPEQLYVSGKSVDISAEVRETIS